MALDWRADARCQTLSPQEADSLFFITKGKRSKRAKLYCQSCPVRQECEDYAILYNEVGIWAGTTEAERAEYAPLLRPVLLQRAIANNTLEDRDIQFLFPMPVQRIEWVVQVYSELPQEPQEAPQEEHYYPNVPQQASSYPT